MILGLVSDTHWRGAEWTVPPPLLDGLEGVHAILHAGDLLNLAVLDALRTIAPVHAVVGNNEPRHVAERLPNKLQLTFNGFVVGLIHGHAGPGRNAADRARIAFPGADVVVFGHTHRPFIGWSEKVLMVNPGSPTQRRASPFHSCARLTLIGAEPAAELVSWP